MCRSEASVNWVLAMIVTWFDIVTPQRHIGRSLRLNSVKHHFATLSRYAQYLFIISEEMRFYNEKNNYLDNISTAAIICGSSWGSRVP